MPSCLIIASHFPPFQSAGVFRTSRLAKYLPDHDWKLEVLTIDPDCYLDGSRFDPESLTGIPPAVQVHRTRAQHPIDWIQRVKYRFRKSGAPEPQTQMQSASDVISGTTTNEVTKKPKSSLAQRSKDAITTRLTTPDRWIGWRPAATRTGKRILADGHIDVLYSSGPPWTNHLIAHGLKHATNLPWVADFRDPWVGNNFRPQRRGETWAGRQHQALERQVIDSADVVIFNTDRACSEAAARYGEVVANKFCVIPNGFDPQDFQHLKRATFGTLTQDAQETNDSVLKIVHTGAFYGQRNVDGLLHAVADLIDSNVLSASDLSIELVGALRPNRRREQEIIASRSISNVVTLTKPIPHQECLQKLANADVLLLVQTDAPLCVPGKLYEYIAVGKTILTLSEGGATADIVTQESLGPCIDPNDPAKLKACLSELVDHRRTGVLASPSASVAERFDARKQMCLFDAALKTAIERNVRSAAVNQS